MLWEGRYCVWGRSFSPTSPVDKKLHMMHSKSSRHKCHGRKISLKKNTGPRSSTLFTSELSAICTLLNGAYGTELMYMYCM